MSDKQNGGNPLLILDGGTVEFCATILEWKANRSGPSSNSPVKAALRDAAKDLRDLLAIGKGQPS